MVAERVRREVPWANFRPGSQEKRHTDTHTHTHTHIEYICEQLEFSIYMYSWGGKLGTWAILTLFTLGKVNLTSLNIFF